MLSGGALAPVTTPAALGIASLLVAVAGASYACRIATGTARSKVASNFTRYDASWYGIAPVLVYSSIGLSGGAMLVRLDWGVSALAAALMALLLVSIHIEWDLVTFLAPDAQASATSDTGKDARSVQ